MPSEAFDVLGSPPPVDELPAVVILFGDDATLRNWVLRLITDGGDAETVEGETAAWRDIRDEVSTVSLFDSGQRRVVIVRDGDTLVKKYRPEIEDYVGKPSSAGRLIVEMKSLASNTRLYKATDKHQLLIHCGIPKSGRSKNIDAVRLRKFITGTIAPRHGCKLTSTAADLMVDLIGIDIGMLDTEIAKVALYGEPGAKIDDAMVQEIVGGWKANTTWQTIDAAAAGDAAEALRQLDRMMASGEAPIALLPQIAWSMRRFGLATAAVDYGESTGRRVAVSDALQKAGFRPFEIKKIESQLRHMGRHRGRRILHWLLDADLKLKGTHSTVGPDRFVLEQFVFKLAKG
jgi:DNA polymerase-3 subunit delta